MEKSLEIIGKIDIGMQELVTVGIAQAERKFKSRLKELHELIAKVEADTNAAEALFEPEAERAVPARITDAKQLFEKVLQSINVKDKDVKLDISVDTSKKINHYTLKICDATQSYRAESITICSDSCPFTKEQMAALGNIENLKNELSKLTKSAVDIRRKLSDFPSLERQIRARVVEQELKKTVDGQAFLDAAIAQFEHDSLLLGM